MLSPHFPLLLENYVHTRHSCQRIHFMINHISPGELNPKSLFMTKPTETTQTKQLRQTVEPVLPQINGTQTP